MGGGQTRQKSLSGFLSKSGAQNSGNRAIRAHCAINAAAQNGKTQRFAATLRVINAARSAKTVIVAVL